MKRLIGVLTVLLFVSAICFGSDTISKKVYSFGLRNGSGAQIVTVIPITSIRPGVDKLIGYSITPIDNRTPELYIGIFDGINKSLSGEVFAENETNTTSGIGEIWPFGKYIFEGIVVSQGAYTQVQVYFVKE